MLLLKRKGKIFSDILWYKICRVSKKKHKKNNEDEEYFAPSEGRWVTQRSITITTNMLSGDVTNMESAENLNTF